MERTLDTMSDLISRQALCDDLREYKVYPVPISSDESEVKGYNDGIDLAISVIIEFPSVELEQTVKASHNPQAFFLSPEEQAEYIQQVIRTILIDPNPSILDVALLPILATDPRNGFSEETRKELMDEFIKFIRTQKNLLSKQIKQINMLNTDILAQINNSMQAYER